MKISLTIDKLTPSNNELLRMNHFRRYLLQQEWDVLVWVASIEATAKDIKARVKLWDPQGPRRVSIYRYSAGRIDSIDNFKGGLKPLVDALHLRRSRAYGEKGNNIIIDDNDKWLIEGEIEQRKSTMKKGYMVLTIEDI